MKFLQFSPNEMMYFIILLLFLVLVLVMMDSSRRRRRFRFELPKIKTELKCTSCGLKEIRDFKQGDIISEITAEKCKRCKGELKVFAIYSLTPREAT